MKRKLFDYVDIDITVVSSNKNKADKFLIKKLKLKGDKLDNLNYYDVYENAVGFGKSTKIVNFE